MAKAKIAEKHVHASLGYKKTLQHILAQPHTLASIAESEPKTMLKKPSKKGKSKKGILPNSSGKQKMQGINSKKERKIHPNQVKDIAKRKLMLKDEKTSVDINPAGSKYHYNKQKGWHPNPNLGSKTKTGPSKIGSESKTRKFKTPSSKTNTNTKTSPKSGNPHKPVTMHSGTTLFSMFDKPEEYAAIRSGKDFVKPARVPEAHGEFTPDRPAKPKSPKRSSGTKVTKIEAAGAGKTNRGTSGGGVKPPSGSSGSSGITPPSGGHYEIPAHPSHKLETYSPLRHFSNMFNAPATARAGASVRGAMGQRQIFRPQSLVMKKSLIDIGIKEKSFKAHLMGVLAAGGMHAAPMHIDSQPKNVPAHENLAGHAKAPEFKVSHNKDLGLKAIASVESSGGKNISHKEVKSGLNKGSSAIGKYGMMPLTVRELATKDHALKQHYGHLGSASDSEIKEHFASHPEIEHEFASRNYDRISDSLKTKDLRLIGHSWNQGMANTHKAVASGKDIGKHPYVKKIVDAYEKAR